MGQVFSQASVPLIDRTACQACTRPQPEIEKQGSAFLSQPLGLVIFTHCPGIERDYPNRAVALVNGRLGSCPKPTLSSSPLNTKLIRVLEPPRLLINELIGWQATSTHCGEEDQSSCVVGKKPAFTGVFPPEQCSDCAAS